ncbi:unnamed protein product [Durusdinium trenchii]|uniref:Methyltransferase FkbM domain-containing protein n=1 Tax=Durusdinium trenchii TaxID=1381693 RepID=A0ABP0JQH5_9DINO
MLHMWLHAASVLSLWCTTSSLKPSDPSVGWGNQTWRYRLWRGREDLRQQATTYFHQAARGSLRSWRGCYGMESLLGPLKPVFDRSLHQGLLIDVGAHYGQSSAAILKVLGEASSYDLECQPQDSLRMMLFEPNPRNCKVLRKQVQKWQRPGLGLIMVEAAVSNRLGRQILHGVTQGGSLSRKVSLLRRHPNATLQTEVDVVTLDWYLQWEDFEGEIFLLKIDAEGFDPLVLRGAKELLRKHRVRYLIFEVDRVWASAGHGIRLDQTVKELYQLGYLCFVLHPKALVPIYAFWWHPSFNENTWTNVFCACEFDPELFAIYLSYTDPAQRPAVLYAAVELQQSSLPPAKPWRRVAEHCQEM